MTNTKTQIVRDEATRLLENSFYVPMRITEVESSEVFSFDYEGDAHIAYGRLQTTLNALIHDDKFLENVLENGGVVDAGFKLVIKQGL